MQRLPQLRSWIATRALACVLFVVIFSVFAAMLNVGAIASSQVAGKINSSISDAAFVAPKVYGGGNLVAADPTGGYWTASWTGAVTPHGGATMFGSPALANFHLSTPIVGMQSTPDGQGYWLVASDGLILPYGDAAFFGSTFGGHLNQPIVGMATTPDGRGYWLVASDGGIFTYGDASFYGSAGAIHLNQPIVSMAATPDGRGYWLVASDGGIFTYGDASFYGSTGAIHLNKPIVSMAATPDGKGYWLVASDGGIFTYGDAQFYGSEGGGSASASAIIINPVTPGYQLVDADGVAITFPSPLASPTSGPEFVQANGTGLTLAGQPYQFTGINIYMAASGGLQTSCGGELYPNVGVPLSELPSGIVIRFFAFQDFFESNGSLDWTNFDQVLAIAAAHGDKVVPVLANQNNYCDGPLKDLTWYQTGYSTAVEPGDVVPYQQYVADVVTRYADNPTIAMWQLVNEGEAVNSDGTCNEPAAISALLGFSNDVGGMIHRLDPNHLVSLGTIAGYSGSGSQWCGAANGDFQTLMASPGNDVCDYHDYGYAADPLGRLSAPNLQSATAMCHADNKPIMVAETGIYADSSASLPTRAAEFRSKFTAQFQAGVVGELMWEWCNIPQYVVPDTATDYGIFPGDPSLDLLGTT
jgi:hypothetical protein